ncbi:MFS-type transporter SLC18B1 isoform X3 [Hydra vulgaris]|uniref:MFS-type transporter SLC18B1 isoform X3 n=1 Tax=Hydra vulgaris TaxID=6087 RepID=UPI0032EA4DC2
MRRIKNGQKLCFHFLILKFYIWRRVNLEENIFKKKSKFTKIKMPDKEFDPLLIKNEDYSNSFKVSNIKVVKVDDGYNKPSFKNKKQSLIIMAVICTIFFASFSAFAIVAPFLPIEAKNTKTSLAWTGRILSCFPLISFLVSPLAGKIVSIPKVGPKRALVFGCGLEGCCEILFGLAYLMPTSTTFVVYCLVLRSITAIGSSFTLTASLAIISEVFKKNRALAFSLTEIFTGIGLMVSPAYGGILFKYGGFPSPFIFTGAIVLAMMVVVLLLMPKSFTEVQEFEEEIEDILEKTPSTLQLLKNPGVFLGVLSTCLALSLPSFLEATLTHHLQEITKDEICVEKIGLIFLIMPATFTASSVLTGHLVDKYFNPRYVIILGQLLMGIVFLLFGPSPILYSSIPSNMTLLSVSLALQGIFLSFANIPILSDMHNSVKNAGMNVSSETSALLSGLFVAFISLGNTVGPIFGTNLTEKYGFSWATSVMSFIIFGVMIILMLGTLIENRINKSCPK